MACEWVSVEPVFIREAVSVRTPSQSNTPSFSSLALRQSFFSLEWNVQSQERMMVETRRIKGRGC